jgi:hypothetical protein
MVSLMQIAIEMEHSKRTYEAYKIVYDGLLPKGVSEVSYQPVSNMVNVKFAGPIDLKRIGEISNRRRYEVDDGLQQIDADIYNHKGRFLRTEKTQPVDPVFRIQHAGASSWLPHPWSILISYKTPDTAIVWPRDRFLKLSSGPADEKEAIAVLEEYRIQMYEEY